MATAETTEWSELATAVNELRDAVDHAQSQRTIPQRLVRHRLERRGQPAASAAVDESIWRLHVRFSRRGAPRDRDALVDHYDLHTRRIARRFDHHREPLEDLEQVAFEALVRSIHRFEPERRVPFLAYADPTIVGSLKRHFRDRTWGVRVSRTVDELARHVAETSDRLHGELGRPATDSEVAEELGVSVTAVNDARAGSLARQTRTFDEDWDTHSDAAEVEAERSDFLIALSQATATLSDADQRIFDWYFQDGALQSEIAERLRCSQMQVSRHLRRITTGLRGLLI